MSDDPFVFDGDHDAGGKVRHIVPGHVRSYAYYSACRKYRYELHRRWRYEQAPHSIMFIMMNPSTATEEFDDPTVKKCRIYATTWGYNHLIVTNIMAYRATQPRALLDVADPIGLENFERIHRLLVMERPFLVCAWGCIPPKLRAAEDQTIAMVRDHAPHVLRLNLRGRPWHPLYLPNAVTPLRWNIAT